MPQEALMIEEATRRHSLRTLSSEKQTTLQFTEPQRSADARPRQVNQPDADWRIAKTASIVIKGRLSAPSPAEDEDYERWDGMA